MAHYRYNNTKLISRRSDLSGMWKQMQTFFTFNVNWFIAGHRYDYLNTLDG